MQNVLILLAVLLAAGAVWFLFIRKPASPEIETPPQPKKLPAKEPESAPSAKPAAKSATPKSDADAAPPPKKKPAEEAAPKAAEAPVAKKKPAESPAPATTPTEEAAPAKPAAPAPVASTTAEPAQPEPKPAAKPASKEKAAPTQLAPRKRDVDGLRKGMTKARDTEGFFGRLRALFTGKKEIDPNIVEQIEEVLLTSDVGVATTELLLSSIRDSLKKKELADNDRVWEALRAHATKLLSIGEGGLVLRADPTVVMVVGVNGVGKTTTIGKLATKLRANGKKVVLAAGDTFRAAAVQQLTVWGKRVGCEVVSGKDGANPGAVIFDAIQRAKEIGADVVLADTAGRLHTKTNLMEELTKVSRTMSKAIDGAPHETLLVLDGTNGQNAMQQAAMFKEALPITGIVLTKLDGTAKGGVILGVCAEHSLPVRYIGIGERAEDLRDFDASEFVEAMLGQSNSSTDVAA